MPRVPRRRERSPQEIARILPEPHKVVLLILHEHERMTWDELRSASAAKGIGEEELHLIMFGYPLPPTGPGT